MPTPRKIEQTKTIGELLARSHIVFLTDYRGLSVREMADLRRQLAASEAECHVVKNRLALLAAHRVGREGMASMLKGPTAMVFGYGDITEPAKVLMAYARASQRLQIKAGLLDARLLTSDEVASVARLPARDVLLAQLVGELQLPLRQLVGVLSNLPGALVRVLQARKQQLEAA